MSGGYKDDDNGNLWKSFIMAEMLKNPKAFANSAKNSGFLGGAREFDLFSRI